jgi:hypothetical protein
MRTPGTLLIAFVTFVLVGAAALACGSATSGDQSDSSASSEAEGPPADSSMNVLDGATGEGGDANDGTVDRPLADAPDDTTADHGDAADENVRSTLPAFHRPTASACAEPRPAGMPGPICFSQQVLADASDCDADQNCMNGRNGRCNCRSVGPGPTTFVVECSYDQCGSDSDCEGGVCGCRESQVTEGTHTVCLSGNCRIDSDCDAGGYCSPSHAAFCSPTSWQGYFCHTANDECVSDSDCTPTGTQCPNPYCAYDPNVHHWVCSTGCCGPDGG